LHNMLLKPAQVIGFAILQEIFTKHNNAT
jgi:hypothetical protein